MVPVTGLEPVRCCQQGILSPSCLPFHHTGVLVYFITAFPLRQVKYEERGVFCAAMDASSFFGAFAMKTFIYLETVLMYNKIRIVPVN